MSYRLDWDYSSGPVVRVITRSSDNPDEEFLRFATIKKLKAWHIRDYHNEINEALEDIAENLRYIEQIKRLTYDKTRISGH